VLAIAVVGWCAGLTAAVHSTTADPAEDFRMLDDDLWEDLLEAGSDPDLTAALLNETVATSGSVSATLYAISTTPFEASATTPR